MTRRELITRALRGRRHEVRLRIGQYGPQAFGEVSEFGAGAGSSACSPDDCLGDLRRVALDAGNSLMNAEELSSAAGPFLAELSVSRSDRLHHFMLLAQRYRRPMSITLNSEHEIAEYLLAQVMVRDRVRVERHDADAFDNDLLLKLNFLAIKAGATEDLRFLDALNYYFEIVPERIVPNTDEPWLLQSFYALYERALAAHCK